MLGAPRNYYSRCTFFLNYNTGFTLDNVKEEILVLKKYFLGGILGPNGARGGILGGQGIGPGGREGILHAMNGFPGGHQAQRGMYYLY